MRLVLIVVAAVVVCCFIIILFHFRFTVNFHKSETMRYVRSDVIIIKCEQQQQSQQERQKLFYRCCSLFAIFFYFLLLNEITFYFCLSLWHVESKCCRCRRHRLSSSSSVSVILFICLQYTVRAHKHTHSHPPIFAPLFSMNDKVEIRLVCVYAVIALSMEMKIDSTLYSIQSNKKTASWQYK